ncbi:MAG: sugar ABC transporter permease [Caldilineaceae bacterium]|nr:sugar ABC transporter permease [Caldilineaceae bacterium]
MVGWLFVTPAVLGLILWLAGPMIYSIWLSLTEWDLIRPPRFIGIANFTRMVEDRLFYRSLWATLYYTAFHVPLTLILAFLVAMLLNTKTRGIAFFRTLYYIPSIVPAVANAVLWIWIFNSEFGLLNLFLRWLGFDKILWLQDPRTAMPALILMSLWSMGGTMIIYLAGLNGIPEQLYEAAEIDGAGGWSRFWNITIPMMTPVIFFNLILQIIGSFQVFTASYLMTRGGPNYATNFYVLYLFDNAFSWFNMGYAAALAWVLFFIILGLSLIVFRSGSRWVYYEEGS